MMVSEFQEGLQCIFLKVQMIVLCPPCTKSYTALVTLIRAVFVFFFGLRSSALPPPLKSPRELSLWIDSSGMSLGGLYSVL